MTTLHALRGWANRSLWHIGQVPRRLKRASHRVAAYLGARVERLSRAAFLVAIAIGERARTSWSRIRHARPRIIWGPTAILNVRYWSEGMKRGGYESKTCIDLPSAIAQRGDFDVYRDEFLGEGPRAERVRSYAMFAWALRNGDVFIRYFDGGFLRATDLAWWELPLLRLAGKKVVVSPFGGDIALPGHLGEMEDVTLADYPELRDNAELTRRRVLHTLRWADVSIRNYQVGFQPHYDAVWPTQIGIDTGLWNVTGEPSDADGRDGEVVVLHAPNHRHIKGTHLLEEAVAELRAAGLKIDLRILERRPNDEIRAAMEATDIVADQFLDPGYALFSLEAMASGKPVLCRMSPIPEELRGESLEACPIVDAGPELLRDALRRLVEDPVLRRELGRAGREFVEAYHSLDAMGRDWGAIVEHAWRGSPLPERMRPAQPAPVSS